MNMQDFAALQAEADQINKQLQDMEDAIHPDHFVSIENNPAIKLAKFNLEAIVSELRSVRDNPTVPRDVRLDCIGRLSGIKEIEKQLVLIQNAVQQRIQRKAEEEIQNHQGD